MASVEVSRDREELGNLPEWDLSDFYRSPDDPKIEADLQHGARMVSRFSEAYRGQIGTLADGPEGGARLAAALRDYEAIEDHLGRLISYAGLLFATSSTEPEHGRLYGDVQGQVSEIASDLLFFTLELNALSEEQVAALQAQSDAFAHYGPWLRDQRLSKPHDLSDEAERLMHEKGMTGRAAWTRLFDESMARLTFDIDGESQPLEAALDRLSDPDRARRKQAVEALIARFTRELPLFTHITNVLAKDLEIDRRWRAMDDVAAARHIANRVEAPVVDALTEAVRDAYPRLSHRYYGLKAKWLGLETLEVWDRNAPLPDENTALIPWDRAQETVLEAYGQFAPRMADLAAPFFEKGWINAASRPGKAGGAFSHPTVPSAHPYVLINYMGRTRDVMTLAHELGHGVHQVLAAEQGALMAETPLTLAETASVFGEMLTFKRLLAEATEPRARKAMLAGKVEDMLNTAVRQIAFYTFERKVHEARRAGELTSDDLGRFWMEVQTESLGPAFSFCDGYETFWSYIPHFIHSPFYVYAYAFGDCLVNSLYAVYEQSDEGFVERYFDMLRAGGTKRHKELLAPFGLDASDPAFWSQGLNVISGMIDELERLS